MHKLQTHHHAKALTSVSNISWNFLNNNISTEVKFKNVYVFCKNCTDLAFSEKQFKHRENNQLLAGLTKTSTQNVKH